MPMLANSAESLAPLVAAGRIPPRRVWGMLALRSVLSFAMLLVLAAALRLAGRNDPLADSAAWWLWFVTLTNIVCIVLLHRFARVEGMRLRDIYYIHRPTWKGDLAWSLLAFLVIGIVAMPPGLWLAEALWGDPAYPNPMLFQPLPLGAVVPLFVLMPVSQALAELPTYWGYVSPRLRAFGLNRWLTMLLVGGVLSLQHMFFAFQWDWRFDLWLAVKFLPFTLWTGFVIDRRPTSLPYLMAGHLILDASLPLFVLLA